MKRGGIHRRSPQVPIVVFQDAETGGSRCINGLHVETFVPNPFGDRKGTLITFASGDRVTVVADFDTVTKVLMAGVADG